MRYSELYLMPKWKMAGWACPYCGTRHICDYEWFCKEHGRPEEAEHKSMKCPMCGESYCFSLARLEWMEE